MIRQILQKRCFRCKKWKDSVQFYKERRIKDGLGPYCKECVNKQKKEKYERDNQPIRFKNRKKQGNGWECAHCGIFRLRKQFHKAGKYPDGTLKYNSWCVHCVSKFNYQYKLKHGKILLTKEEYNNLFLQQFGKCAICSVHQAVLKTPLNIDHKHGTKEIRGLLCGNCNRALGLFKEDIQSLQNAILYLNRANIKIYKRIS